MPIMARTGPHSQLRPAWPRLSRGLLLPRLLKTTCASSATSIGFEQVLFNGASRTVPWPTLSYCT
eukprot:8784729-Pyramimonas_sp.AAC.1